MAITAMADTAAAVGAGEAVADGVMVAADTAGKVNIARLQDFRGEIVNFLAFGRNKTL
jgi:flavin-binding protein dodecin